MRTFRPRKRCSGRLIEPPCGQPCLAVRALRYECNTSSVRRENGYVSPGRIQNCIRAKIEIQPHQRAFRFIPVTS